MIQLWAHRAKADLDVAQALAVRKLSKGQDTEMILTGKRLDLVVAPVPVDTGAKSAQREQVHDLRKYDLPAVHPSVLSKRDGNMVHPS